MILKDMSIWEAKPKATNFWLWKRLIWIRDKFPHLVGKELGIGQNTSFWYESWHPWGIRITQCPELRKKVAIRDDAKVLTILVSNS